MEKNYILLDDNRVVTNCIVIDPDVFDPASIGAIENTQNAGPGDQFDENGILIPRVSVIVDTVGVPLTIEAINAIIAGLETPNTAPTII